MKLKFFGYGLFVVGCILFSLYVRFPGQTAARYIEQTLSQLQPTVTLTADPVRPSFPFGLKTDAIEVSSNGLPLVTLNRVSSRVDVTTVFANRVAGSFKTEIFHGVLSGKVHVSRENPRDVSIDSTLKDLKLKDVHLGKTLSDGKLSGILNGTIVAGIKQQQLLKNEGDLIFTDLELRFPDGLFSIETYFFSSGNLKFSMPKDQIITIEEFSVKGRQLDLQSSGDIRLARVLQDSQLNMTARVVLYPLFFMNAGDSMPVEVSKTGADNAIVQLRIGGTLQNPTIVMDSGAK